ERYLPKQADKEKQKKCEAEGAPVDELLRRVKKAGRWNERSADQVSKIPWEPFRRGGNKLSVYNCGCDQNETKDDGSKMKTNDARYVLRRFLVVRDVISGRPVFIAPDVTEQDKHKACQIENEFFNWNWSTYRRDVAAECGRFVWKGEERVAEEQI